MNNITGKRIRYILLTLIPIFLCYCGFFWNTGNINRIFLPSWAFKDNCNNPKILAWVTRVDTYKNAPGWIMGVDFLLSLVSENKYFRQGSYLTVIELNQQRILYEIPNINMNGLVLSPDSKWIVFESENKTFLTSLENGIQKQIQNTNPSELLDWGVYQNQLLFVENRKLYSASLDGCLEHILDSCEISKKEIPFPIDCSTMFKFGKFIDRDKILIKKREDKIRLIQTDGKFLNMIPNANCKDGTYDSNKKEYVFACPHEILKYSSNFEYQSSVNYDLDFYSLLITLDGKRIVTLSEDEVLNFYRFDTTSENSFSPSRPYIINSDNPESIRPIYERTDEFINWMGILGNGKSCQSK
jgi:hypothetical protein